MRRINITGQVFGRLTALNPVGKGNSRKWKCLCTCGKETFVACCGLRAGTTKSCGCLQTENNRNRFRKGEGLSGQRKAYTSCKRGALDRGHVFNLSFDSYVKAVSKPCFYCGVEFSKEIKLSDVTPEGAEYSAFKCNGLDRVDNTLGYMESNIVACCSVCNYAKRTLTQTVFIDWIQRVHSHLFGQVISD